MYYESADTFDVDEEQQVERHLTPSPGADAAEHAGILNRASSSQSHSSGGTVVDLDNHGHLYEHGKEDDVLRDNRNWASNLSVWDPFSSTSYEGRHFHQAQQARSTSGSAHDVPYPQSVVLAGQGYEYSTNQPDVYVSGRYSRANYVPARSRSPTPIGDEDYSVGDPGNDVEKGRFAQNARYPSSMDRPEGDEKSMPETPLPTRHYGPAPLGRVARRHKYKQQVPLTDGNLVVEIPVPTALFLPRRGEKEMMQTRYTAVTCDPDDFVRRRYSLRQNLTNRRTELFIVVTMYNEDEILFCRTLYGVMRNISHLCSRKASSTWGPDSWKKVVVCIVADGRSKVHPRVLDCLAALGVYQAGDHMKKSIDDKEVQAHLFEYTTSFGLDPNIVFRYSDDGIVPTQILFCLKERNQKKINSHRWFFSAFAPLLQPNVCILLDVGTRPGNKSLYHLWKTFDINSHVGGACGEIAAYKGKRYSLLLNPLVAAQNFEYKMSNILDKPTESIFGYISVLPGAFSAYRYIALQNDEHGVGPLASYFKGEVVHGKSTNIFETNMYLAEDRILCFELVAKAKANWVLRYVKAAVAETDVPDALPEFISQRRRWLNGSLFATLHSLKYCLQLLRSGHSNGRKMLLMIQTLYNVINLVFSWFAIGNYYLFFVILVSSMEDPAFGFSKGAINFITSIVLYAYPSLVVAIFLFSMGNKPRASKQKYFFTAVLFALLTVYMIFCAVMCAIQAAAAGGSLYSAMLLSIICTYGSYAFSSVLAMDPWHLITSFLPYMLFSPTYINILNIYAFSNLDDISWGTKEDAVVDDLGVVKQDRHARVDIEVFAQSADVNGVYEEALHSLKTRKPAVKPSTGPTAAEKEQAAKDYYANMRGNVLLVWVLSNGALVIGIMSGGGISTDTFSNGDTTTRAKVYMSMILAFVAMTSFYRFAGSTLYLIDRLIFRY